ncbi:MAG: zinc ribbon domain-containing protein [Planctomycetaceae bacterium]
MSLIDCPECGHQVSTKAPACPHCGVPMGSSSEAPAGPRCYACSAAATTRCMRCEALSCAEHLRLSRSGPGLMVCKRCQDDLQVAMLFLLLAFLPIVVIVVLILSKSLASR